MQINHRPLRRLSRPASTAALLSGLALATACAAPVAARPAVQASIAPNGSQQITVGVGDGMSFDPPAIAVKAGQPVQPTLENRGGLEHDFTLTDGVSRPVKIVAKAGQTAAGAFTIDRPGTYEFVCSVPGHAMAGMRGTITAQ